MTSLAREQDIDDVIAAALEPVAAKVRRASIAGCAYVMDLPAVRHLAMPVLRRTAGRLGHGRARRARLW